MCTLEHFDILASPLVGIEDLGFVRAYLITSIELNKNELIITLGSVPILGALHLSLRAASAESGSSKKAAFS